MRKWGCPKCGHQDARVTETGRDPDGNKVRLRRCTNCQTRWATEERPIDVSAYYPRVGQHFRDSAYRSAARRPCRYCGEMYPPGFFSQHVRFSKIHHAALKPVDRNRAHARKYAREWKRAHSAPGVKAKQPK
jgi:hypothetical protein